MIAIGVISLIVGVFVGMMVMGVLASFRIYEIERKNYMTGLKYQMLAARTMNKKLNNKELELHALHGMVGEIGEIHSLYQKVYQGHLMDKTHLEKELGDLLWFIAEFCTANDMVLDDVMEMNIEKLKKRFPEGFTIENSIHRREGDI